MQRQGKYPPPQGASDVLGLELSGVIVALGANVSRWRAGDRVTALVAGGVREEIQRAFLLHRFEVWLGGGTVGVIVTSVAFGAGHLLQGDDAAIVTGLLGAFWGMVYLRRRSAVAPMVSHAGFDLVQILQFVIMRTPGGQA